METHTGTVAVNAAFLKEVKEDNSHLRDLLVAVAEVLSGPLSRKTRPRALAELLARLRDQLETHFSLEEFFGYLDDALDVAPHLSARADVLQSQHAELFSQLCDIVSQCEHMMYGEGCTTEMNQIAISFQRFHKQLQKHEADEADLIMDALYQDIGVGD